MALIVPGPMASVISGKIAGTVFSHNSGGKYTRALSIPTNPNTGNQQVIRGIFGLFASRWATQLTQAQRDAWDAWAAGTSSTNRVGEQVVRSGQSWYIGINTFRLQGLVGTTLNDPPAIHTQEPADTSATFVPSVATGVILSFDDGLTWVDEDGAGMVAYLGQPVNPGVQFYGGPFRKTGVINGDSATPPSTPETLTPSVTIIEGMRYFLRLVIQRADGRMSNPFIISQVATA